MAVTLPLRGDVDRYVRRYSLDGVTVSIALAWRQRTGSWYMDMTASDGTPILTGQRVSPGVPVLPDPTVPGAPPGALVMLGPDPYLRGQIGSDVRLVYLTAAEIARE